MGGKLDFYNTPAEQRNVFSKRRFSEKIHKKRLQNYDPKNMRTFSEIQKTIMVGGMSTTAENTILSWDNSVLIDGDRQRKCLSGDR